MNPPRNTTFPTPSEAAPNIFCGTDVNHVAATSVSYNRHPLHVARPRDNQQSADHRPEHGRSASVRTYAPFTGPRYRS
jgi:hypothetical protein